MRLCGLDTDLSTTGISRPSTMTQNLRHKSDRYRSIYEVCVA